MPKSADLRISRGTSRSGTNKVIHIHKQAKHTLYKSGTFAVARRGAELDYFGRHLHHFTLGIAVVPLDAAKQLFGSTRLPAFIRSISLWGAQSVIDATTSKMCTSMFGVAYQSNASRSTCS